MLAAAGVLLGPAASVYSPWLLLQLAEERTHIEQPTDQKAWLGVSHGRDAEEYGVGPG
jgi:hypothetical protein